MPSDLLNQSSPFLINGPSGKLEVAIDIPKKAPLIPTIGIVCHPHPLFGGTMHNKVVTSLSWAFTQLGAITVRFNYRGVGSSEGRYGDFIGEQADLRCIIQLVKDNFPDHDIWLGGFSFGSFIAAKGAEAEPLTKKLITVAPAVNHADFYHLTGVSCPWFVIQGDKDDVVPPQEVYDWAEAFKDRVTLKRIPPADHFFNGQIVPLRQCILEALGEYTRRN